MWPAPVLLLFLAGSTKCIQQPVSTAQNQQSYWPEESSYTSYNAASTLLDTAVDGTWQDAFIPGAKTSLEQPMSTKQDEWRSSRWPKETSTIPSYPAEWLIAASSNPSQTATSDVKPYGGSQEAITQRPYSEKRLNSSTEDFEQPFPTSEVEEESSWWSKETTTNPPLPGEWLNPLSNPSQTATSDVKPYGGSQEAITQRPYSEKRLNSSTEDFEQPFPTSQVEEESSWWSKETTTNPPLPGEWLNPLSNPSQTATSDVKPYGGSQEAITQRPYSEKRSNSSTEDFEQPFPTSQVEEESSWWSKETTTNPPLPGEWLNPLSNPSQTATSDVKPYGGSKEAITQRPYSEKRLSSSTGDFEQPLPTSQVEEESSWWSKETTTNPPLPGEWLNPLSNPSQTETSDVKPYGGSQEAITQRPYSEKKLNSSTEDFEHPFPTSQVEEESSWWSKETTTNPPLPGEWLNPLSNPSQTETSDVKPYGGSREAITQRPYSEKRLNSSTEDFEQPLPTSQDKEESSWWSKETTTNPPLPGEWLNPLSNPSQTATSDVKPYGGSQEATTQRPYSKNRLSSSTEDFEQPLPTSQDKEESSWWSKEKTTNPPLPGEWLDLPSNPNQTATSDVKPYGGSQEAITQRPYSEKRLNSSTGDFEQPLSTSQVEEQSSWWSKEITTNPPLPGEWLNPLSNPSQTATSDVKPYGDSQEATTQRPYSEKRLSSSTGDFEQPLPTSQDKEESSWWSKEKTTNPPLPGEWLNLPSNPSQTAASDVKPYGDSQEATTQRPYSENRLSSSTGGFEQPLPTSQDKEESSWWSKEKTTNPPLPGEWLNLPSNLSQIASNEEDLYDNSHEVNAQEPYSEQFTISPSRSFEQKAPTKEPNTTAPYPVEWLNPYGSSQEAQRPYSDLPSADSSRSLEQPLPAKQLKGESPWWQGETTSNVPYPWEWLNPTPSTSHLADANNVKPYGNSQETTTQKPYYDQKLEGSSKDFEQSIPAKTDKENYSMWPKETSTNVPYPEWILPVPKTPKQTDSDPATPLTENELGHSFDYSITQSLPTTISENMVPNNSSQIKIKASQGKPKSKTNHHDIGGSGLSTILSTSQWFPTTPSNSIDTTEVVPKTEDFDRNTSNSISTTLPLYNSKPMKTNNQPKIMGSEYSPVLGTSQSLPTSTSNPIEPHEIKAKSPKSGNEEPTPNLFTKPYKNPDSNVSSTHPQKYRSGHLPGLGTYQPLPPLKTNIEQPETMNKATTELDSEAPTIIPFTEIYDNPNSLESSIRPHIKGSGRSPVLDISQSLPTVKPNILEFIEITNTSKLERDTPTSMPSSEPHYNHNSIKSSTRFKTRGSGRSVIQSPSQSLPSTKPNIVEHPEIRSNTNKLDKDTLTSILLTGPPDIPNSIESSTLPQIRGSGHSQAVDTSQPLPPIKPNNIETPEIITSTSQLVHEEPISISSKDSHDNPKITENSTPPQVRGSGRSTLFSKDHTVPMGKSQQDEPTYPTKKEIESSKHDDNAPIPSTSPAVPKPNEVSSQVRGSGRSPIVSPTGVSSSNMPSTDPFHYGMTKETSMFMPLPSIGNTHSEGSLNFPIEHAVVENVNDYYFNSPTDQQPINNNNDILVNSEPKQVKVEQGSNSNAQSNMNEQDIPELNLVNDYHLDEGIHNHHIPKIHHHHHHHHHTARRHHHTGHKHHGLKHHQHVASQGHAKKHHHATTESLDVEKEHNVASLTISKNNYNPTSTRIVSLNSKYDMPEIAYFLYV